MAQRSTHTRLMILAKAANHAPLLKDDGLKKDLPGSGPSSSIFARGIIKPRIPPGGHCAYYSPPQRPFEGHCCGFSPPCPPRRSDGLFSKYVNLADFWGGAKT